jgi:hypothetical protein
MRSTIDSVISVFPDNSKQKPIATGPPLAWLLIVKMIGVGIDDSFAAGADNEPKAPVEDHRIAPNLDGIAAYLSDLANDADRVRAAYHAIYQCFLLSGNLVHSFALGPVL